MNLETTLGTTLGTTIYCRWIVTQHSSSYKSLKNKPLKRRGVNGMRIKSFFFYFLTLISVWSCRADSDEIYDLLFWLVIWPVIDILEVKIYLYTAQVGFLLSGQFLPEVSQDWDRIKTNGLLHLVTNCLLYYIDVLSISKN